jgi:hypothetical protein
MKHYRVKFGYGKDDFISIEEGELSTALRAQITGKIGSFKEGTVAGNNIMAIVPDFQKAMGWNRDHQLGSEDYAEIGTKTINDYRLYLEETKDGVYGQLEGGQKLLKH